jgi:hypothetical protein
MQYYNNYIGYKQTSKQIGIVPITAATGGAALPITAIIDVALIAIPFLIKTFESDAASFKKFLNNLNSQIQNQDPRQRLGTIIATGTKLGNTFQNIHSINFAFIDRVADIFLWYRQNYPNDYQNLLATDKEYFNETILSLKSRIRQSESVRAKYDRAMFTNTEINYISSPLQGASNILSNLTKNPTSLLLYGGIGLGLLLLLKK